ncbi:MAG: phosphate ABC transporter substrate-binding protein PstS [Nitrososphaerales archaeon]|nr:phosphate ABC transporter substrate-binding protein PstS [Nitrososphaerales archaeon]
MRIQRNGVSASTIALAVVLVVVVVAAGAYVALSPGAQPTTVTSTLISTTTTTSLTSSVGPTVSLNGAGGTLVFPLMSAWTFAYAQVTSNVQVNYASVGSGAGIAQITAKTVNFGESDAPLTAKQYAALNTTTLLTIPISASAVVPAYNLPGMTNGMKFTGAILAQIFLGNITQWNDAALVAINAGVTLPAHAITVIHRSDGSGTMFAFTNYLSDASAQWKTQVGQGTSVNWPTGLGCKGNEGVAGCISNTQYSIGPLEIAYEIVNKGLISYGSVQNAAGKFILANLTNAQAAVQAGGTAGLPAGSAQWTSVSIINNIYNDTAATNVYPITTFTYALAYQQQTDQTKGAALVNFLWWVVNSAQVAGANLGYVPLPANVVALDDATLNSITYNGTPLHTGS